MNRASTRQQQLGFSLIELMTAMAIFLLLMGATFTLLAVSQKRYQTDSQVLNAFQEARLGLDQMVRDINDSGFPPQSQFAVPSPANFNLIAITPFAWSPGYPAQAPCAIGVNCLTPNDFDLIVETSIDPQNNTFVQWIRYKLQGTTLSRGVVEKAFADDPLTDTDAGGVLVPYVQNVMNNATPAQIAQFEAIYPGMFPGGSFVPIFSYTCDSSPIPQTCSAAGPDNSPKNIRSVEITLIVMTPQPDAQTGQPRLIELHGSGRRVNPNK